MSIVRSESYSSRDFPDKDPYLQIDDDLTVLAQAVTSGKATWEQLRILAIKDAVVRFFDCELNGTPIQFEELIETSFTKFDDMNKSWRQYWYNEEVPYPGECRVMCCE